MAVYTNQQRMLDSLLPDLLLWVLRGYEANNVKTFSGSSNDSTKRMMQVLDRASLRPLHIKNPKAIDTINLMYPEIRRKVSGEVLKNLDNPLKMLAVFLLWIWVLDDANAIKIAKGGYLKEYFQLVRFVYEKHPDMFDEDSDFGFSCIRQMKKVHEVAQSVHIV